jgi:hypothetical protein
MKKFLLGLFVMFLCTFTVNASVSGPSKIEVEGIDITAKSTVSHDGTLSISYDVSPKDADDKTIIWSSSKADNLTVTFDYNKTTSATGTVKVTFNNKNANPVKVIITAEDSTGKITKSIEVTVQDQQTTTNLESNAKDIEELIKTLDNKITKENYSKTEETLGEIDTLFEENDGVKDFVDDALMIRYEDVKEKFENYKDSSDMTITAGTIVTIVILVLSFIFG